MEKEMIRVVDTDGIELDVELVSILEDKEENNKYLVYTKGETQRSGNLILYISKVLQQGSNIVLENISIREPTVKSIITPNVVDTFITWLTVS